MEKRKSKLSSSSSELPKKNSISWKDLKIVLSNEKISFFQSFLESANFIQYFRDTPTDIPLFIEFIRQKELSSSSLAIWTQLLISGREQEDLKALGTKFLEYMNEKYKTNSACGYYFKSGDVCVSCKNCQVDSTCVMCMACFSLSDHKGHDFRIHKSGGGMCDCGDPEAWAKEGFCTKHQGLKEDFDAQAIFPANLYQSLFITLKSIVRSLCISILQSLDPNNFSNAVKDSINFHIEYLNSLTNYGQGLINIIGKALYDPFFSQSFGPSSLETTLAPLDIILQNCADLLPNAQQKLYEFLIHLVIDYRFKKNFAFFFANHYSDMWKPRLEFNKKEGKLLNLAVQVFTVPSISLELVKKGSLNQIFSSLEKFFKKVTGKDNLIDCSYIQDGEYWKILNDVRYILANQIVSQYIVYNSQNTFHQLLSYISLGQYIVPHQRYVTAHIERELPIFNGINLELSLLYWSETLVKGFALGPPTTEPTSGNNNNTSSNVVSLNHVNQVLIAIQDVLNQFWNSHRTIFPTQKTLSNGKKVFEYNVLVQPVSMNLPLHRTFSIFLKSAISQLNVQFPPSSFDLQFIEKLLEEPLRIHVLIGQISAGLWKKNGLGMYNIENVYKSGVVWSKAFSYDLFLIQFACTQLGFKQFLSTFFEKFKYCFPSNQNNIAPEVQLILEEEMLEFLLTIFCQTHEISLVSREQLLHRELVHRLILKPQSHNDLLESIPKELTNLENFDEILSAISIRQTQSLKQSGGISQTVYILKEELWSEFEGPAFQHYTKDELQNVMEKWIQLSKKNNKLFPRTFAFIYNQIPLYPGFEKFQQIPQIPVFHSMICSNLQRFTTDMKNISERTVLLSLMLLHYIVFASNDSHPSNLIFNDFEYLGLSFLPSNSIFVNSTHPLSKGKETCLLTLLLDLQLQTPEIDYLVPLIEEILSLFSDRNSNCKEFIHQYRSKFLGSIKESNEDELNKKRAEQRKQQLLAQFSAQQKAFQMNTNMELEIEEEEEFGTCDKSEENFSLPECSLCRKISKSEVEDPVGFASYIQSNKILQVVNRNFRFSLDNEEGVSLTPVPTANEDSTWNVHYSTCRHSVHSTCFNTYFDSLISRNNNGQPYEGQGIIDLEKREFLCPTCRRLSNCLVPVVSPIKTSIESPNKFSLAEWITFHQSFSIPLLIADSSPLEESFKAMAQTISIVKTNNIFIVDNVLNEDKSLFKAIEETISCTEVAFRKENGILDNSKCLALQSKFLQDFSYLSRIPFVKNSPRHFINNLRIFEYHFKELFNITSKSIFKSTCHICGKITPSKCGNCKFIHYCSKECQMQDFQAHKAICNLIPVPIKSKLVSNNCFSLLLSMAYCWISDFNYFDALGLIHQLFRLHLVQALVFLFKNGISLNESEKIPEQLLSLFNLGTYLCFLQRKRIIDQAQLWNFVKEITIPFLRRAIIWMASIWKNSRLRTQLTSEKVETWNFTSISEEYSKLLQLLEIEENFLTLLESIPENWIEQFEDLENPNPSPEMPLSKCFKFVALESEYLNLLTQYREKKCLKCGLVPKYPGLCLICGGLICLRESCCKEKSNPEALTHIENCCGKGLILIIKEAAIFALIRKDINSNILGGFFPSIYLDKYGDQDIGFSRGKPLFLSLERLEELRKYWLNQISTFDHQIQNPKGYLI